MLKKNCQVKPCKLTKTQKQVRLMKPYQTTLLAFTLGAITVLGFAPFYIYPVPILAVATLIFFLEKSTSPRDTFKLSFSFGLGLFIAGIYWIFICLHTFGNMPAWMAAIFTFLLCAFMALFIGLSGYFAKKLGSIFWAIPLLWALSDWTRSWIFTGFPWLTLGYTQTPYSPLAGYAPIVGVYGVTLISVAVSALLAYSFIVFKTHNKREVATLIAPVFVIIWLVGCGLKFVPWSTPIGEKFSVALLQGNIAQDQKWLPENAQNTLDLYWNQVKSSNAKLIVMPETALPMRLADVPNEYLEALTKHAVMNNSDILVGVVDTKPQQYFNNMFSLGVSPTQTYTKSHLVPFGEFIPLKQLFGFFYRDYLNMPLADFSRGDITQPPLNIAGQKVAVDICYEDVFGEEIARQLPAATVLVNASNDAWYGESIAAYQHMQISQTRAIETARMMLRATNTGATAIIDKDGIALKHAPHFIQTVLEGEAQGYEGTTPYVRFGNWPMVIFTILGLLIIWRKKTS